MSSHPSFRFLCFGAGAIGTYIGGSLALSGQSVTFVERPQQAEVLRRQGLRIRRSAVLESVPQPFIVDSLADAFSQPRYDFGIVAVKSYDTVALLDSLLPFLDQIPPIICFQNGVENEGRLASVLGTERVISGTVTTAVGKAGPGEVSVERLRGIGIASGHADTEILTAVLDAAGLKATLYPHAAGMKWSKMFTNLLANASSAILNMPPAQIFNHPDLYRLELAQLRETLKVMHSLRIPVSSLPGTPVKALAWAVRYLPALISQPVLASALGKGRGKKMPSFHIDLYAGNPRSEVDDLNGAVLRFAKQLGQPAPANEVLNRILLGLVNGDLRREDFAHKPEALLEVYELQKKAIV